MFRTCLVAAAIACATLFTSARLTSQCVPIPAGCFAEPPPVCIGPPSSSAGFGLTCAGSPALGCSTPPILMIGLCALPPLPVPPPIGCSPACGLAIGVSFGTFPDPSFIPPGLPPGFTFCAQCGCIALLSVTPTPCVNLADAVRITVVP